MIPHFYQSVPGWFDFEDLYSYAVASAPDPAVFVEIGAWLGKSTAYLAVEAANSGKQITLHVVDTWRGSPGCPTMQAVVKEHGGSVLDVFMENMRRGGVRELMTLWQGKSPAVAAAYDGGSVDFCFIDADHQYESVCADIAAWWPNVKSGGLLAGHDYDTGTDPGVVQAVNEAFPGGVQTTGRCWLVRKG